MFPQHKLPSFMAEQSDNKNTTVTKAAFGPQFNVLHIFLESYSAKERVKRQATVTKNTTSCNKRKLAGPLIQKLQDIVM